MRIIKEPGSDVIPCVRLYGLRQTKRNRGRLRYRLFVRPEFHPYPDRDLKIVILPEFLDKNGWAEMAYIDMGRGLYLHPYMIPPIALSSLVLTQKHNNHLWALLAGPSAKLSISLGKDGTVRFSLRIGEYRTAQSVPLEKVNHFLEPKPL